MLAPQRLNKQVMRAETLAYNAMKTVRLEEQWAATALGKQVQQRRRQEQRQQREYMMHQVPLGWVRRWGIIYRLSVQRRSGAEQRIFQVLCKTACIRVFRPTPGAL